MASIRRYDASLTGEDFRELSFRLMSVPGFLPDILKDYQRMLGKYEMVMQECQHPWAMVDSHNKMGGVFWVCNVEWEHTADFMIWVWNPACYTATTHRAIEDYLVYCAASNQLDRLVCRTPDDKRLGRLLERLGFKLEGRFAKGYRTGGKSINLYQFRRIF